MSECITTAYSNVLGTEIIHDLSSRTSAFGMVNNKE